MAYIEGCLSPIYEITFRLRYTAGNINRNSGSIKKMEVKVTNRLKLGFLLEKRGEISSILRRFLINTLFDSTFMQLGIIMGSAFAASADLRLTIGTLVASSVALGISTGVSVYESETLEREKNRPRHRRAL
jgi:hypothetical protein